MALERIPVLSETWALAGGWRKPLEGVGGGRLKRWGLGEGHQAVFRTSFYVIKALGDLLNSRNSTLRLPYFPNVLYEHGLLL